MEVEFDRSKYPTPLLTSEDYRKACEEFVLPFMQQRAAICADIVDEMKALGMPGKRKLDDKSKEEIKKLADKLKDVTGFASKEGAKGTEADIHTFIQEVIALERALETSGEFANEPK